MFTPAKYFLPAVLFTALTAATFIRPAAANAPAWQVQQAAMTYQNSGVPNPEGALVGISAQVGFDPKKPEDGQFQMSFSTTGLFLPRAAMGTRDPDKMRDIAMPAGDGNLTATRMERKGDTIGVSGTLTINGQSRPVIFNMGVAESSNDTGRSLHLTGQFIINRPSFATKEMGYVGPANIPVKFDVSAIAQAPAQTEETPAADAAGTPAAQAQEPGAAAPPPVQNAAPQNRLLTEEDLKKQKEENSDIGVVRTFGGGASSTDGSSPSGYGATQPQTPEVGTVRTFGGSQ
jgi:polyisoprenoid-binding protein YceI